MNAFTERLRERIASTPVPSRSASTFPFLCLLAGGCAIGFAPIFVRLAETGAVASAFWRCALAAPALGMWAWHTHRSKARTPAAYGAMLSAGLFLAGDLGVWHWSILYTSVANAALLLNLAPVFVIVAGWLFWHQKVTATFLLATATAIAGMAILVGLNFDAGGTRLLGDGLGALAGAFYAGYLLSIKAARDAGASTARLMAWSTATTALILLPNALVSPQPFLPHSPNGWWVLAGLAFVVHIFGQGLIAYALAHLPASLSSVSLFIQPVTAMIFAWILFGEVMDMLQLIGGAVVLIGISLARKTSNPAL